VSPPRHCSGRIPQRSERTSGFAFYTLAAASTGQNGDWVAIAARNAAAESSPTSRLDG
jgi:hypothetical protein